MYKLFSWYAWGFGKWQHITESHRKEDVARSIKEHGPGIYAIVKDGEVIEVKNRASLRPGMCAPSFPIRFDGKEYKKRGGK